MTFSRLVLCVPAPIYGLAAFVAIALGLEGVVRAGVISRWILPPPSEIASAIWQLHDSGLLDAALVATMRAVAVCSALVIAVGVSLGYLLYRYPLLGQAYAALLGNFFAIPLILFFPIFLVIFGRNYSAVVACAFLHCVLPVIIYTREALTGVPAIYLKVAATFRTSNSDRFWKILLPNALPRIFLGVRLSALYVLVYVIGIEFVVSLGGLGQLISDRYQRFEIPQTFAAICFVVIFSAIIYFVLRGVEEWMRRTR